MKLVNLVRRVREFILEDIWNMELTSLSGMKRTGIKMMRVVHLVVRGYKEDQCPLHASALTFSTLMSIVPVLAVSLAMARGFGAGDVVQKQVSTGLMKLLTGTDGGIEQVQTADPSASNAVVSVTLADIVAPAPVEAEPVALDSIDGQTESAISSTNELATVDHEEIRNLITAALPKLFELVEGINFNTFGIVGLTILLFTVVMVLGRVESSFNRVWGIRSARPLHRKFLDYLSVLIVLPILAVAASSVTAADIATRYLPSGFIADFIRDVLESGLIKHATTVLMTTVTFAFVIMFVPNTKVSARAGFAGGFIAALLFVLLAWACANLQILTAKHLKIYASFAALPIILFWVHFSWQIILFGAEVAFAVQNCTTYQMETQARGASVRSHLMLALAISVESARSMVDLKQPPFTVAAYAVENRVPIRLLNHVVEALVDAGLFGELSHQPGAYVLLRSPDRVTAKDVMDIVLLEGVKPEELGLHSPDTAVEKALLKADAGLADGLQHLTIRDMIA